jgi:hypothetical protein
MVFAIVIFLTCMPNSSNTRDQGRYMVQKPRAFYKIPW